MGYFFGGGRYFNKIFNNPNKNLTALIVKLTHDAIYIYIYGAWNYHGGNFYSFYNS